MHRQSTCKPLKWRLLCLLITLSSLLLISLFRVIFLSSDLSYLHFTFTKTNAKASNTGYQTVLPYRLRTQVSDLQKQLGVLLEQLHTESSESKHLLKFSDHVLHIALSLDTLADNLSSLLHGGPPAGSTEVSNVDEDLNESEESDVEEGILSRKIFNSGELYNYTLPKPNRLDGKKNFFRVESVNLSVGQVCAKMASNVDRFMTYKVYGMCPDDCDTAQKLIAGGCDPLPRRRCFSRTPPHYSKPLAINTCLWTQPSDVNIVWNHYKCKTYSCLVSNQTIDRRGFFKCVDCFNLSKTGWDIPTNDSVCAEFNIDEVLLLKPGEIRIGLTSAP